MLNHRIAEDRAHTAIHDAMVKGEREVGDPGGHDLTRIVVRGAFKDLADRHNADLRMVNDRRGHESADVSHRGDRERAAAQFIARQSCPPERRGSAARSPARSRPDPVGPRGG